MSVRSAMRKWVAKRPEPVDRFTSVEDMLDALELARAERFNREAARTAKFVRCIAREAHLVEEAI